MTALLEFLSSWWGLIAIAIFLILELILEYEITVKRIRDLIFVAEEKARKRALGKGEERFEWVKQNGYALLPPVLKLIMSEELFGTLVQHIFKRIKKWTESRGLTAE